MKRHKSIVELKFFNISYRITLHNCMIQISNRPKFIIIVLCQMLSVFLSLL